MMQAGTYYVGDLCYVMNDKWDDFCDKTITVHECLDGEFTMSDGSKTAHYGTAHGDGIYYDQEGRSYPVDAGLIGCILLEDITDPDANLENGNVITFDDDFECKYEDGNIIFGDVVIVTDDCDDEDNTEDEEDYVDDNED